MRPIILGSGSPHRRAMLEAAGLVFQAVSPTIDERAVEESIADSGATPEDLAAILAEAKGVSVSERYPDALVIGADQTLALDGVVLHKPETMEEARRRLLALSGRTHVLNSAVVIAEAGEVRWRHDAQAHLSMRKLDPAFVGRHLSRVGDAALTSVGAYQVEGEGIQLFEKIEGDFFP